MIFLLLVYSLTQRNSEDLNPIPSIQSRADVSCNDLNNCRTISGIILSCLSTIFLCTWVTLHPNIAIARDTRGTGWFKKSVLHPLLRFMKNKFPLFLCALLAPEYILGWAVRQYFMAGDIKQKVPGWTRKHGFFMIMGGFHLYRLPQAALSNPYPPEFNLPIDFAIVQPLTPHLREEEVAEHPLEWDDISIRALAYLAPSETEIKDKGKTDALAKFITFVQILWFVFQCIARGVQQLPLTEIEVVTLAYTMVNLFIYYFWWDKPKDVKCPIRVYKALGAEQVKWRSKSDLSMPSGIFIRIIVYIGGGQDHFFRLRDEVQVPMFWSGTPGFSIRRRTMMGASIVGIAFGAIHFIAWNYEFPSHAEFLLWRVSCVAITATPLSVTVSLGISEMGWTRYMINTSLFFGPLNALLYVFTRIATLTIAFTTLRALPLGAFKTVDWTTFIPHL